MKNKTYTKIILFCLALILLPILFYSVNAEEEIIPVQEEIPTVNPETLSPGCTTFNGAIIDSTTADSAIECGLALTNEQFLLASPAMQEKYVLSNKVDFSSEEQNSIFIRTILKEDVKIDESKKEFLKRFFTLHEDYMLTESTTHKSVKNVFEKVANQSIDILNEINTDNQNNIAYQRYFNTVSNFLYVNSAFKSYDNNTGIFVSEGTQATTFTTKDIEYFKLWGFSDFFMESDGRFKAKNYNNVEICTDCNYYISPDGKTINVQSGQLNLNGKSFTSDKPYVINVKENNAYEVIGSNIMGINPENSETTFKANGKITLTEDHYILGENTKYTQYQNNAPTFEVSTEKEMDYFYTNQPAVESIREEALGVEYVFDDGTPKYELPCKNVKNSCTWWNPANDKVYSRIINNDISISDTTNTISHLDIQKIDDTSTFRYSNPYAKLIVDKSGSSTVGDITKLSYSIYDSDSMDEYLAGGTAGVCTGPSNSITGNAISDITGMQTASNKHSCSTVGSTGSRIGRTFNRPTEYDLPEKAYDITKVVTYSINPMARKFDGQYVEKIVKASIPSAINFEAATTCGSAGAAKIKAANRVVDSDKEGDCYIEKNKVTNSEVVIIAGHHHEYEELIWGDNYINHYSRGTSWNDEESLYFASKGRPKDINRTEVMGRSVDLGKDPNTLVVMFSSCNTIKSNTEFKELLDLYNGNLTRPEVKASYGPEVVVQNFVKIYPNLRLIIGYNNVAPGYDQVYSNPLQGGTDAYASTILKNPGGTGLSEFSILERSGFEAYGNLAVNIYNVNLESINAGEIGDEKSGYRRNEFGRRIAYYYRVPSGEWYFFTNYWPNEQNIWIKQDHMEKINIDSSRVVEISPGCWKQNDNTDYNIPSPSNTLNSKNSMEPYAINCPT